MYFSKVTVSLITKVNGIHIRINISPSVFSRGNFFPATRTSVEIRHKFIECLWGNPTPSGFQIILYNPYIVFSKTWRILLLWHSLKQAWTAQIWKYKLARKTTQCDGWEGRNPAWLLNLLLAEQGTWRLMTTTVSCGLSSEQKQTLKTP